jgi:comEA protein
LILEKIKQKVLSIGITGKELKLLLFLLLVLFIGLLIQSIKAAYPKYEKFDYASVDSMFVNLENIQDSADIKFMDKPDTAIVAELINREKREDKSSLLANGKININTAGITELKMLPGIGEKTAGSIIAYRNQLGSFKSADELMNVKGIGQKKFDKIKSLITLSTN